MKKLILLLSLFSINLSAATNVALQVHLKLSQMTAGEIKDVLVEKGDYVYNVDFQDKESGIVNNRNLDLEDILKRNFQYLNDGNVKIGGRGTFTRTSEAIDATFKCGRRVGGFDHTCRVLIEYSASSLGVGGAFGGGTPSTFKVLLKTAYFIDYNPATFEVEKIYIPTQG